MDSIPITFHCTVCDTDCFSKCDWLAHLVEDHHQLQSREDWKLIQIGNQEIINQYIVIFAKPSLVKGQLELLQSLSRDVGTIVTDFVWFPEQPKLALLQFESKLKVLDILEGFGNNQFLINNQIFQLRAAADVLPFEWNTLLPCLESEDEPPPPPEINVNPPEPVQVKPQPPLVVQTRGTKHFHAGFQRILNDCIVPEFEHKSLLDLVENVEQQLQKDDPKIRVCLSRNWAIGLKYNAEETLIVAYRRSSDDTFFPITNYDLYHLLLKTKEFPKTKLYMSVPKSTDLSIQRPLQYQFTNWITPGRRFNLMLHGHQKAIEKAMLWKLFSYLIQFDVRCQPVLAIIYFWTAQNKIELAYFPAGRKKFPGEDLFWITFLVIIFMCHDGYLPKPRQVLRSEGVEENCVENDVEFTEDKQFLEKWLADKPKFGGNPKDFTWQVLGIVTKFFQFGSKLARDQWVSISGAGEFIRKDDLLKLGTTFSSLTETELDKLKEDMKEREGKFSRIYITNPLSLRSYMCIRDDPMYFKKMKATAERLDALLNGDSNEEMQFRNLRKLLAL